MSSRPQSGYSPPAYQRRPRPWYDQIDWGSSALVVLGLAGLGGIVYFVVTQSTSGAKSLDPGFDDVGDGGEGGRSGGWTWGWIIGVFVLAMFIVGFIVRASTQPEILEKFAASTEEESAKAGSALSRVSLPSAPRMPKVDLSGRVSAPAINIRMKPMSEGKEKAFIGFVVLVGIIVVAVVAYYGATGGFTAGNRGGNGGGNASSASPEPSEDPIIPVIPPGSTIGICDATAQVSGYPQGAEVCKSPRMNCEPIWLTQVNPKSTLGPALGALEYDLVGLFANFPSNATSAITDPFPDTSDLAPPRSTVFFFTQSTSDTVLTQAYNFLRNSYRSVHPSADVVGFVRVETFEETEYALYMVPYTSFSMDVATDLNDVRPSYTDTALFIPNAIWNASGRNDNILCPCFESQRTNAPSCTFT